ncbi:hypothetical protein [Pedobacter panaciterrae]
MPLKLHQNYVGKLSGFLRSLYQGSGGGFIASLSTSVEKVVDYCDGFIGIVAAGQKASAQSALLDRPKTATRSSDCDSRDMLGEVLVIKLMKVDDKNKLQKYMLSNCKLDKSISGRFDMSFNLKKEGR